MFSILDKIYFRVKNTIRVIKDPDVIEKEFREGYKVGIAVSNSYVTRALDDADPFAFSNDHFKLGYYYAYDSVKKVMSNDENHLVDQA